MAVFKDCGISLNGLGSIDLDFISMGKDKAGYGYTFQEMGNIFLNDLIVGRNKGKELPNMIFYINSNKEIKNIMKKIFFISNNINLNEICLYSGVNEFDHVIKMNEDLIIEKNNPYFRHLVYNYNIINEDLKLKKDNVYFLEFKKSFQKEKTFGDIEKNAKLYCEMIEANVYPINININTKKFQILYLYNNLENTGYDNIKDSSLNADVWKFLYVNPSCHIPSYVSLSIKFNCLENEVKKNKK